MLRRGRSPRRRITALAALLLAGSLVVLPAGSAAADPGPIINLGVPGAIANQFIVDLKESVPRDQTAAEAQRLLTQFGGASLGSYTAVLGGFAMTGTPAQAALIAGDPAVAFVQQDVEMRLQDTQMLPQPPAAQIWHLDRIDQAQKPLNWAYRHGFSEVPIYVVDSGVNVAHPDFEGRASAWFNAFGPNYTNVDCARAGRGHGTLVAGAAASKTYGVSKRSRIFSVKVFDCNATTTIDILLKGINEVAAKGQRPSVVNMSFATFNGSRDKAIDDAVLELVNKGYTVTIAAGNDGFDACNVSPANISQRSGGAITVGASSEFDTMSVWSSTKRTSYGPCVSLFAPGTDIVGPHYQDISTTDTNSGTSFAAPQVAGAAALILAKHPTFSPQQVRAALLADASPGPITDPNPALNPLTPASSKRLLYISQPDQPGTASGNSLEEMFRNYGNQGGHWTGGDETMSIKLPGSQGVAWFFGDSFLGTVNPDGTRPRNSPIVNNAVVMQQGNSLVRTLTGGTAAKPDALVGAVDPKPDNDLGWWPGEARLLNNDKLQVFYTHVNREEDGGHLSFKTVGRSIAQFSLPGMTLDSLLPVELNTNARIGWGAAMVDGKDDYTYIYGSEMVDRTYHMYIARAPKGRLLPASGWQFWTGASDVSAQWSTNEADAKPTISGVGSGFSVKYLPGRDEYVLATQDTTQVFSSRFVAMFAKEPTGPFVHQTLLFNAPEASVPNAYVYTAKLHQEFASGDDQLVVSYNVNSYAADDAYNNADLYRPKFRTVNLKRIPDLVLLPDAPTGLTASSPDQGRVRLSWTPPSVVPGTNLKYWIYERNTGTLPAEPSVPPEERIPRATHFERSSRSYTTTTVDLGLLTAGTYEYKVSAENLTGEGPPSLSKTVTVTIEPPKTAPANLTAKANDDGTIGLRWDAVTAAGYVNYRVYQRDVTAGETDAKEATSAEIGGTTAVLRGLTHAHTYEYTVSAWNNTGEGPRSAPAQATVRVPPPPAPTNLTATANGDGTITLNWTSAGPQYWYYVYTEDADDPDDEFTRSVYPISNGTTFTAGYLTSGHRYRFYVVTIGDQGVDSVPSNIDDAVAQVAPPAAPTNLRATANDDGTVTLNWAGPAPDVWYWVYWRKAGTGSFERREYPAANGPTMTLGMLELGQPLEFYVTTIGEGDTQSGPSNTVRVTPGVPPPPAPTSLNARANDDGTVTLDWNGSHPDEWYWIYLRNTRTQTTFSHGTIPATSTSATMGGLTVGDRYEFYVTAIGQGTESAKSNTVSVKPYLPAPAAPSGLTVTAGNGEARLSWRASTPGIWHYVYSRNTRTQSEFTRSAHPIDGATTATMGLLSNGDRYEFYVVAIGQGNVESAPSNTVSTVPHVPRPPTPANLTLTSNTNGNITLNWGSSGSGIWYAVSMRNASAGSGWTRLALPVSNGTSFTATGLTLKDYYEFRVLAIGKTAGFDSGWSSVERAQSKIPLPSAPALSGQPRSDGTIGLSWTAPAAGLWYYVFIRDVTAGGGFVKQKYPVTNGTSFTAGMLKLNHVYEFRVSAINAMGEGAQSNTYRATSTLPAPSGLTAGWSSRNTAHLSWNGNADWFYYVYVSENGGPFVRNSLPVNGRTWQDVTPLSGDSYRFYITRAGNGGETAASNIATVTTPFPLPAAGDVATYHSATPAHCVEPYPGLRSCSSTVTIRISMTNWATRFQHNGTLNVQSRITADGKTHNVSTSCFALGGVYRCDVTTSIDIQWWGSNFNSAPTVCASSTAFADYYRNPRGTVTRVSAADNLCFRPGTPEA